jgi:hypothetical protein
VRGVVEALERQYDAYLAGAGRSLLAEMGGSLPTAEELGDELERFLAEQAETAPSPPRLRRSAPAAVELPWATSTCRSRHRADAHPGRPGPDQQRRSPAAEPREPAVSTRVPSGTITVTLPNSG